MTEESEPDVNIKEFDTVEEVFDFMNQIREQAKVNALPFQWKIGWGDHFLRLDGDVPRFGYILTRDEVIAGEKEAGATAGELESSMDTIDGSHENGYRFGRVFSVYEPKGELGSTHVVSMYPLSHDEFEEAKHYKWTGGTWMVPIIARSVRLRMSAEAMRYMEQYEARNADDV